MSAFVFFKGALLGVALAAPLGPIGALCINRALNRGFSAGVAGGLGTAIADAVYAALAAFGFVAFQSTLALVETPIALLGGVFLLWLGYKYLTSAGADPHQVASKGDLAKTISTTFLLTISNPATILTAAALFASFGFAGALDRISATILVAGVFAGSTAWWVALSASVTAARRRLPKSFATWVNRGSGIVIAAFGALSLCSAVVR